LKDAGGARGASRAAREALDELTQHQRLNLGEAAKRLRFPALAARPAGEAFNTVVSATLQRRKLWMEYHARSTDEHSERTVSPQRIVHYREAWYLDAWDESRDALRSFSVDRIRHATILEESARSPAELDEHYASATELVLGRYGRFTPESARWVADERWHPEQKGAWLADGSYELTIPYRESRELVMDVMRHGPNVEVINPPPI
jgi:predicted DNA-binding transcriptional regulator YafY